jgi:beta-N-acetylhexosaminidase
LSLSQLAGQRIIYAYRGLTPPKSLLARIRKGEAAGVILFGPNIASRKQLRAATNALQAANRQSPVDAPLLTLIDQEGGLVRRLPGAPIASEKQIGQLQHGQTAVREAGVATAANLTAAGINVNLAPVLDVYRRPGNFIDQYQRSYSSEPVEASSLGSAFIQAQQAAGVAATAKHFPGLGTAARSQNTDLGPVQLQVPLAALRTIDEAPFRSAINTGVRLVMLSWAVYPALDPSLPAGLSPMVIQRELRSRLGYRGVAITDSLGAGALAGIEGFAERGRFAAVAGEDLVLCSAQSPSHNTPNDGVAALHGIAAAIASHETSRTAAEQAAARVIALRSGLRR